MEEKVRYRIIDNWSDFKKADFVKDPQTGEDAVFDDLVEATKVAATRPAARVVRD
jgi:hypothetical protein